MKKAGAAVVRVFRLMNNYFELLQMPQEYDVDLEQLKTRYETVRGQIHPDRFANKSDAEKRVAVQYSALLNDAYQTLLSPVKRAVYLLKLGGQDLDLEHETIADENFLVMQMQLRERIDAGEDVKSEIESNVKELTELLSQAFSSNQLEKAKFLTQKLQFFIKIKV